MKIRIHAIFKHYLTVLAMALCLGCDPSAQSAPESAAWEALYQEGKTARGQGHFPRAESLFVQALATVELPPTAPRRLELLHHLAEVRAIRGDTAGAGSLYRLLLERQQDLPPYHPLQTAALSNWARLHRQGGQFARADSLLQRALDGLRRNDRRDPLVGQTLDQLAALHRAQNHFVQADSLAAMALGFKLRAQGYEHFLQQRYNQAETFYQRALKTQRRTLGAGHIALAATYLELAQLHQARSRRHQAEAFYRKALGLLQRHPSHEPATLLEALDNYANLLHQIKRPEQAARIEEKARRHRSWSPSNRP